MSPTILKPTSEEEIIDSIQSSLSTGDTIEVLGHGSKRGLGLRRESPIILDMSDFTGIELFEPQELVLSAKSGTPISEIESLLSSHNQELQFEPVNLNHLFGLPLDRGTLGGLVHTNICGPRRLVSGSVRDHLLGVHAISGRGEPFKSGGRVVKNVTGYDLSKGIVGSYGTLSVATQLTVKVMPRPESEQSLVLTNLDDKTAALAMSQAMGSSMQVSGAAHLPSSLEGDVSQTCFRLEGFAPSVMDRLESLSNLLSDFGIQDRLDQSASKILWQKIRDALPFSNIECPLWRISCVPMRGHEFISSLPQELDFRYYYDWQGGLIWLEFPDGDAHSTLLRSHLSNHGGGHATLIRCSDSVKLSNPPFEPQSESLASLSSRYRTNFNPQNILNPSRMGD